MLVSSNDLFAGTPAFFEKRGDMFAKSPVITLPTDDFVIKIDDLLI